MLESRQGIYNYSVGGILCVGTGAGGKWEAGTEERRVTRPGGAPRIPDALAAEHNEPRQLRLPVTDLAERRLGGAQSSWVQRRAGERGERSAALGLEAPLLGPQGEH